jgi:hypothetical protein
MSFLAILMALMPLRFSEGSIGTNIVLYIIVYLNKWISSVWYFR